MRTPLAVLAGLLLVGACSSGTKVVYMPYPAPAPVSEPAPVEEELPPVGVTIVRAEDSDLLVSTNQPAYLAVFEIVPNRGTRLVYPRSPRQRQVALSGSNRLAVWWGSRRGDFAEDRYDRVRRPIGGQQATVRYVYAVASAQPLRITADAYDDEYLRDVLGSRTYRAVDPYATMEALTEHFLPRQMDEDWGEDLFTMDLTRTRAPARIAKIYCPDGSITYVREELAHRASCPTSSPRRGPGTVVVRVPRPDSVVASNGRPIVRRNDPRGRDPFRIPRPGAGRPTTGPGSGVGNDDERGNSGNNGNNGNNDNSNNGNHNGWSNGNGNTGNTGNTGTAENAENAGNANARPVRPPAGSGIRPQGRPVRPTSPRPTGVKPEQQPVTPAAKPEQQPEAKPETRPEAKPEQQPEAKPEAKPEQQPEAKPEAKPEHHPAAKPEQQPEAKPEAKPEQQPAAKPEQQPEARPEAKPEAKPEQQPAAKPEAERRGGAVWQRGPKRRPDASDSTDTRGKP